MNYCDLFTPHHIALIHDWIERTGRVFVRIERPHSGATGDSHVVRSLKELRTLLVRETHPEIEVFVFQEQPYPDDELHLALDHEWVRQNSDRVLYLGIHTNRNYYGPFGEDPKRYAKIIRQWAAAC